MRQLTVTLCALLLLSVPARSEVRIGLSAGPSTGALSDNGGSGYSDAERIPFARDRETGVMVGLGVEYGEPRGVALRCDLLARSGPDPVRLEDLFAGLGLSWRRAGGHLRALFGMGLSRARYLQNGLYDTTYSRGTGILLGAGWDMELGDRLAIGPGLHWRVHGGGDPDVVVDAFALTLTLTYRLGE